MCLVAGTMKICGKKQLVAILLMFAFAFSIVELHADCELDAKAPASHCCVQCCPAHNLAPTPNHQVLITALPPTSYVLRYHSPLYSVFFALEIDRPPIA